MLLTVDIGNTNIVLGLYDNDRLTHHWRIATDRAKMPDEYALLLRGLFAAANLDLAAVSGVILASVVPPVTETWQELCERYLGRTPLVVGAGVETGVRILIDNPREVGADRIVNAAAAYQRYGGPAIVIDFGTATTFDAVSPQGDYLGGAIAPGVGISAEALFERTAKLPRIELTPPPAAIGKNTVHAMQSGLLLGYVAMVEGMVARFQKELGGQARVIATGGLAEIIAQQTTVIEAVDPWLTLEGLRLIWQRNRGSRD